MKRQFLCGRDFGSSCPMKIDLTENTPAGLIIIRDRENNTKKSGGRDKPAVWSSKPNSEYDGNGR